MRFFLSALFTVMYTPVLYSQSGKLVLTNHSGVSRVADPVVISREVLSAYVDIPDGAKILTVSINGAVVPSQLDDLNQDGKWDELAFQTDIDRNSKQTIKLKWVDIEDAPTFPKKAQVRLGIDEEGIGLYKPANKETRPDHWYAGKQPPRYLAEGPVWENEILGFRQYFDARNLRTIFGKQRPGLIADSLAVGYAGQNPLRPWGMDVVAVTSTLGAGGIALIERGEPKPIRNTELVRYQQIANGPVRAMFDLVYQNWNVNGNRYHIRERISMWNGMYGYRNEVIMSGFTGEKEIAVGLPCHKNEAQPVHKMNNLVFSSLSTHARQSENEDYVGLGILFRTKIFAGFGETPRYRPLPKSDSLSHTYYASLKIRSGEPVEYQFFACWEKSNVKFGNAKYFGDIIQEEADRLEFPLLIGKP